MKKLLSIIFSLILACSLLCGCSQNGGEPVKAPSRKAAKSAQTILHAEYMVSDGEYIYYCPTEPLYDFDTHFGGYDEDSFICSLRRVAVADALDEPLEVEEILAEQNCHWLCLHDGQIYFADWDENAIYRVPATGGEAEALYVGGDSFDYLENLNFIGDYLYFTEETCLKRIAPDENADAETVFEVDDAFADFADQANADFIAGDCALPYGFEFYDGQIYLIVGSGMDYYGECYCLIRIDPDNNFSYELVCGSTSPNLALCGGNLYYQQADGESDFGDPMLHLIAYDGEQATDTGVFTDSRNLFSDGKMLYYDKYIDTMDDFFAYIDAHGEEPDFDLVEGRFLFSYSEEDGEQQLDCPTDVMYIVGVAENILWYENFADHIWMSPGVENIVYMATESTGGYSGGSSYPEDESVPYESTYGPGTSYLDLDAEELSACFRLLRTDGTEEFFEFLNPYESCTKSFPSGRYILKIAEGTAWISDEEAFGSSGHYSTTDFYTFEDGYSYYIGAGTTGDFYGDSASGFLN